MERRLDIRTPESVTLTYDLAGIGSRMLAVMIDLGIQIVLAAAIFGGLAYAGSRLPKTSHTLPAEQRLGMAIGIALLVVILFVIFFAYFIVFEAYMGGQTPGKRALSLRVVRDGGFPLDLTGSIIRNILRIAEMLLGFYILSAISALLSSENKRLGDFAAGTIVVREGRIAPPTGSCAGGSWLDAERRAIVLGFLARRATLDPQARRSLAARLAASIRADAPPELYALDDEALLERV
ncbi:MAG: RDD family protein [Vulcanimicrobiaceae bacterium]